MSYHINPKTGDVNKCNAKIACKFANKSMHYDSKIDAHKAYEDQMQKQMIAIQCEFGEIEVIDGDLSSDETRQLLINGLCGDVALAVHNKTGNKPFFVTYDNINSIELEKQFNNEPDSLLLNTTHVMIASSNHKDKYVDAYGTKSLDEIKEFYGPEISIVEGNNAMLNQYSTGKNNFENFADSIIQLDKNNESYHYIDNVLNKDV